MVTVSILAGCTAPQKERTVIPDKRAGPNLVIYFAEDSHTRRIARTIAQTSGGELFDLQDETPLPDVLEYETFFVGTSLKNREIPTAFGDFLSRTDFMDAKVIPFWSSREPVPPSEEVNQAMERRIQGARFLPGGGFELGRRVKTKDLQECARVWTETALEELGLRRAAGGDQTEDTVKLFAAAYPGRFSDPVFQNGDWTLAMDGVRWYYAQGRFLPEEDAQRPEAFRPQFLYRYTPEPPVDPTEPSPWQGMANALLSRRPAASASLYRPRISPGAERSPLFESIWQARTKAEAFSHQQWIRFLGWQVQVHQDIVAPLGRVEDRIHALAEQDEEIQEWMKKLHSITGWNWRNVAGSENRSFHAYGVAVDLLMKAQRGMETYWQWTAAKGVDWRSVPMEKRQNPPVPVIRAFEEQGFIWGGRWSRFDTMHFEYHPELLILGTGRGDTRP
ncbi:MAG: M15 family metallopeptidase [Spirochaetaceae bacterium]|jgi:flavodoxin|nr:M15 family metallopeptidase [Spirochaetaceae bacterium]